MKSVHNALKRRGNGEKGFTLIELLIVVIIIGILAAIAVPIYLNQRKAAWNASVESDVKNASLVAETVLANNNGAFPSTVTTAITSKSAGASIDIDGNTVTVSDGNYITFTPATDSKDSTATYTIVGWSTHKGTKAYQYKSADGGKMTSTSNTTGGSTEPTFDASTSNE